MKQRVSGDPENALDGEGLAPSSPPRPAGTETGSMTEQPKQGKLTSRLSYCARCEGVFSECVDDLAYQRPHNYTCKTCGVGAHWEKNAVGYRKWDFDSRLALYESGNVPWQLEPNWWEGMGQPMPEGGVARNTNGLHSPRLFLRRGEIYPVHLLAAPIPTAGFVIRGSASDSQQRPLIVTRSAPPIWDSVTLTANGYPHQP
jgi:hypothetical protein